MLLSFISLCALAALSIAADPRPIPSYPGNSFVLVSSTNNLQITATLPMHVCKVAGGGTNPAMVTLQNGTVFQSLAQMATIYPFNSGNTQILKDQYGTVMFFKDAGCTDFVHSSSVTSFIPGVIPLQLITDLAKISVQPHGGGPPVTFNQGFIVFQ